VIADSIVLQQFAMLLALKNGLNPDAPIGLLKVTKTK
jgi:fructoselysine-6-P-deglycase FrlB-like protein